MREKDIKELRAISSPLMFEREVLIKPTKRFINLLTQALDEVEINAKSGKESEGKSMLHNVTVKHEENKVLEWVWVMIAMRNSKLAEYNLKTGTTKDLGEESRFMDKKELSHAPTLDEIAQFLSDSGADFVSVVQNYRFENELPF